MATIYKLYIFFLPFGNFLNLPWMGEGVGNVFTPFSSWFMYIGMLAIVLGKFRLTFNKGIKAFGWLWLFMAAYTILAAIVWSVSGKVPNGLESPDRAILGDLVLYARVLLSLYFNYYCLTHFVRFRDLFRVFDSQIAILVVVGIFQMLAFMGYGTLTSLYSRLAEVFSFVPFERLVEMERGVCLFQSEPSHLIVLCYFVLPYLIYRILFERASRLKTLSYVLALTAFLTLFLFSNSTSVFVCAIAVVLFMLFFRLGVKPKPMIVVSFCVGAIVALNLSLSQTNKMSEKHDSSTLAYTVLDKFRDKDNMSTAMRASTVINDMLIFLDFPFTGVGEGLQGYFYAQNVPAWAKRSDEVRSRIYGQIMSNGGGNFMPSYISAYGCIGLVFLVLFLVRYKRCYDASMLASEPCARTIFLACVFFFLLANWYIMGVKGNETLIFLLSLPCVRQVEE